MSNRNFLRRNLLEAWEQMLQEAYAPRLINSERGLQVHFCLALLAQFEKSKVKRRLFIEPRMTFSTAIRRYPDVVICNTDRIIGVVELKYAPRGKPSPEKDINTLLRLSKECGHIALANERYRGPSKIKHYSIAHDAVLCWAGVYAAPSIDLPPQNVAAIGARFLRLDGLTSSGSNPRTTNSNSRDA